MVGRAEHDRVVLGERRRRRCRRRPTSRRGRRGAPSLEAELERDVRAVDVDVQRLQRAAVAGDLQRGQVRDRVAVAHGLAHARARRGSRTARTGSWGGREGPPRLRSVPIDMSSTPITVQPSSSRRSTRLAPMKPAAPVTPIVGGRCHAALLLAVVVMPLPGGAGNGQPGVQRRRSARRRRGSPARGRCRDRPAPTRRRPGRGLRTGPA